MGNFCCTDRAKFGKMIYGKDNAKQAFEAYQARMKQMQELQVKPVKDSSDMA